MCIGEDLEFIIHVCYWCIPLDHMKSILIVKKKESNLIRVISSDNICSGIKSQQAKKKKPFVINSTKNFSQNSYLPFHRVTFRHSISCLLLIDKPNECCKNSKKIERNALSTIKKSSF